MNDKITKSISDCCGAEIVFGSSLLLLLSGGIIEKLVNLAYNLGIPHSCEPTCIRCKHPCNPIKVQMPNKRD